MSYFKFIHNFSSLSFIIFAVRFGLVCMSKEIKEEEEYKREKEIKNSKRENIVE